MNGLPTRPEHIPYRYAQLNPRWKAKTAHWTPEQWHNWRLTRTARLITRQKVISQRELEARLCDFVPSGNPRLEPHHIASIKSELDLVQISDDPVPFYTRRKMRKLDYSLPLQHKQLLHHQYREITSQEMCGSVAEKVVLASMQAAAAQNPALVVPSHSLGSVSAIDGFSTAGSLDTYCYYMASSSGLTREAVPVGIEVKNIRHWVYPESQELWQLVRAATELNCIPILVTRRIHVTTGRFCRSVGMVVFETQRQYFAPGLVEDPRLLGVFRDLYFRDVLPWDGADPYITKFFASTFPPILERTATRFTVSAKLLRSYAVDARLHADDLPHDRRTSLFHGFRAEFLKLTGQAKVFW